MLNISANEIIERFDNEYSKVYKSFKTFWDTDSMYKDLIMQTLTDPELLGHIIFANDYLKVPPVISFIAYYSEKIPPFEKGKDDYVKKGIGSVFWFLFRYVLGYDGRPENVWVAHMNEKGVKTASWFRKKKETE